jgi:hypothetical protein
MGSDQPAVHMYDRQRGPHAFASDRNERNSTPQHRHALTCRECRRRRDFAVRFVVKIFRKSGGRAQKVLIALSAKNAILIVDMARDRRLHDNKSLIDAAVEAAGAVPADRHDLVRLHSQRRASGAGDRRRASARQSIGQWHDRFNLSCGPVRAIDFRRRATLRGVAFAPESTDARPCPRSGIDIAVAKNASFASAHVIPCGKPAAA